MRARALALTVVAACSPARHDDVDTANASSESTATTASETVTTSGGSIEGSTTDGSSTDASTGSTESGSTTDAIDPLEDAIARGIAGAIALADEDIVLLLLMDVAHRRFAIDELAGAAAQYDAALAMQPDPPIDAVAFRRMFDPMQTLTLEQLAAIAPGPNEVTVPALFCDQLALEPEYGPRLEADAALGSYELTHVALALDWLDELGCASPLDAAFHAMVAADMLALVDPEGGVDDLELEAALFAALLDGPGVVPSDMLDATLAAQLPDGTWPHDPGDATGAWHATGIGLLLLLELSRDPVGPFVAAD